MVDCPGGARFVSAALDMDTGGYCSDVCITDLHGLAGPTTSGRGSWIAWGSDRAGGGQVWRCPVRHSRAGHSAGLQSAVCGLLCSFSYISYTVHLAYCHLNRQRWLESTQEVGGMRRAGVDTGMIMGEDYVEPEASVLDRCAWCAV